MKDPARTGRGTSGSYSSSETIDASLGSESSGVFSDGAHSESDPNLLGFVLLRPDAVRLDMAATNDTYPRKVERAGNGDRGGMRPSDDGVLVRHASHLTHVSIR